MERAKWYKWHSLLGLKLAILSCFILITGTLAVLSQEIDWLTNSALRVDPNSSRPIQWPTLYAAAREEFPHAQLESLSVPDDPWYAAQAIYLQGENERFRAYFHPVSGEYQGLGRWYNWQRFFRMTHRHLMLPLPIGITIVCIVGLLLFGSLISGTVIYRGWWKGLFRWPRRDNRKVFWGDIHRLFGLWSLWLLLILCLTGIWYLVEQWGARATYPATGSPAHELRLMPEPEQFALMLEQAQQLRPDIRLSNIDFPGKFRQVVLFEGQGDELLVRDRANNIALDPLTNAVLSTRHADQLSLHARISEAADPLHFGYFGGFFTKVIYFMFGLVLSALAVVGTWIYALRVHRRHRPYHGKNIWKGMHWGGWLAVLLVAVCLFNAAYVFS